MVFLSPRSAIPIPHHPIGLTPDWMMRVLPGARLDAMTVTQLDPDRGFSGGRLYRCDLIGDGVPASVVVKLSPADPAARAALGPANAREVGFYAGFPPRHDLPVPRCHHAAFDQATGASVLVLEDIGALRAVSFLDGLGAADAACVVTALAQMQARLWNSADLAGLAPQHTLQGRSFGSLWQDYPAAVAGHLPGAVLPNWFLDLGQAIAARQDRIFDHDPAGGPLTCLHGDLQADNILFAPAGTAPPLRLIDWQFAGRGRGVWDLGYFLISSLSPATRRTAEVRLLALYHGALDQAGGGVGVSLVDLRRDYLTSVAGKIRMTVAATLGFDFGTPHKQAWRRADLDRIFAFCQDHAITARTFDP